MKHLKIEDISLAPILGVGSLEISRSRWSFHVDWRQDCDTLVYYDDIRMNLFAGACKHKCSYEDNYSVKEERIFNRAETKNCLDKINDYLTRDSQDYQEARKAIADLRARL